MSNKKDEVLIVLTEKWNDWEAGYAGAVLNSFSDYTVKTIAVDEEPKRSMAGIKGAIDYTINTYDNFESLAMVILPGGLSWEENDYEEISFFIEKLIKLNVPVAAICGAAEFLCKHGFLNDVKHTGDSLELFKQQEGYTGEKYYVEAQVVSADNIITANETAAVEFAYEIFKVLKIDTDEEIETWYDNFKNGAVR